ncbi:MAG: tRNA uracil 4-sulfurtransferase ThiI [Candidatus Pacearchaeota archaeon]
MKNHIVVHYSEIGTKGKNRKDFENRLAQNIKRFLKDYEISIYKRYGKYICKVEEQKSGEIVEILKFIPGISYLGIAKKAKLEIADIKKKSYDLLSEKEFETFVVDSKRSNKNFELKSQETNKKVGEHISKKLDKKVKLKNADINLFIEIGEKEAFIYDEKFQGPGGLPIGSAGKVISSLSGGLDSPVASYLMMKRGCETIFGHLENQSLSKRKVKNKIENLVKELSKFQSKSKLYIIPFEKIQRQITIYIPGRYRMIVYKRFMLRILNKIAKKEKAKAIVTGDSVSQVASQTLENLNTIYKASELPVLAPLVGMNKNETIDVAKKIQTYETSIKPYPDCCSYLVPKQPETYSDPEEVGQLENKIENKEKLIEDAVKNSKFKKINYSV